MMEKHISPVQHRKILFLISLPCESQFEKDKDEVDRCLQELRELHVDVREHIYREDLADAINFDIVIVVSEYDIDRDVLSLHRGYMSVHDFVCSLPKDFKGVLDFASCYSIMAFSDIKEHCPQCKLQALLGRTPLLRRMLIYPSVIELLQENPEVDYRTAYNSVSKYFDKIIDEETKTDEVIQMTHLGGQQMSRIYAPRELKRGSAFKILVFFHYNEEEKVVEAHARIFEKNSELCGKTSGFSAQEGDVITVTVSFDSIDNDNIKVKNEEYTKSITLKEEWVVQWFVVYILPDFKGSNFQTNIELEKGGKTVLKFIPFDTDIIGKENEVFTDIKAELLQRKTNHKAIARVKSFAQYVSKPECAEAVIKRLHILLEGLSKPKDIMRCIRAAKDAGAILKPDWEAFCAEFGANRIKSKTSFNDYLNETYIHYGNLSKDKDAYEFMIEEFRKLII